MKKTFLEYLSENKDKEKIYKSKIGLVRKRNKENLDILEMYNIESKIIDKQIKQLNSELRKHYKGKFKFDITECEEYSIENLSLNPSIKDKIKEKLFDLNSEISKIKFEI